MEILSLVAFLVIGALAGLIGGLLGLSGGIVTVPSLVLVFHLFDFPQTSAMHVAIGTSLSAMVLTGIASTWAHHRRDGVIWAIVFSMIPGIIIGCLLGAFVAHFLSGVLLQIIFGLFISLLGAYILLQKRKQKQVQRPNRTVYTWFGFGVGSLASLLGIGGGVFTVPLLIAFRYPEKKAIGSSAAISLVITFLAALAYLYFGWDEVQFKDSLGYIYLPAFALIGIGTIFFAPLGVKIAHRMQGIHLRKVFAATLIIVGILMIFN